MRRVQVVLSAAAFILSALPALSQEQGSAPAPAVPEVNQAFLYYNYGVLHYMNKDYAGASKSLEQAMTHGMAQSPNARYVLGNTYFLTDKRDNAINMWNDAAKLDPVGLAGAYSKFCVNWVRSDDARKANGEVGQPTIKIDDSQVKASLPSCPSIELERPSIYEVSQWSDPVRAGYLQAAQGKILTDQQKLNDARTLFVKAQSTTGQMVPTQRETKETSAEFNRRRDAYVTKSQQLLKPYQEYVIACQNGLKDANQILDACRRAYRSVNNMPPPNGSGN